MNRFLMSASAGVFALVAAGCSTPVPQALKTTDIPAGGFTAPIIADAQVWPKADWWTTFGSPEMSGLVVDAQANNLDLAAAYARVLQAEAQAGISRSSLFPQLGGSFDASRQGSHGVSFSSGSGTSTGGPSTRFHSTDSFNLGLDASYQLDIFGQNRDRYFSAEDALRASRYAQQTVALTIESNTARAYINVLALRERIKIARDNVDAVNRVLEIVKAKVQNGVSSNLDLAQEQAQVAAQQAQIPGLVEQEREARYALAVLLGRAPEGFDVTAKTMGEIKPPAVQPGLPSDLLLRRPDVAESEASLASAHGNVDAARAAFFPSIGLSGSGGFASAALGSLFNGTTLFYSVGASVLQTIFDGGLLASESDLAKAQQLEMIATYRSSVLNAFTDVESSLGTVSALADQEHYLGIETDNAREALRISEIQYREGVADLLAVLQAQQTLFTAEDQLVQTRLARLQSNVSLYQSLGGGWSQTAEDNTQAWPVSAAKPALPEKQ
ncbi:MAG TPA: efflux transporter outer membrane subunit [Rhizomicrobium sp.]|jgi:NodT family efflux transporter outer membrane factor (OMF) lipoprotein